MYTNAPATQAVMWSRRLSLPAAWSFACGQLMEKLRNLWEKGIKKAMCALAAPNLAKNAMCKKITITATDPVSPNHYF